MKRTLLTYLIILVAFQSYSQTNCDCWGNAFIEENIDYESAVLKMENAFIQKGYLKDHTPKSYLKLADSIIARNEYYLFKVELNPILVEQFENCFLINSCNQDTYKKIRNLNNQLVSYRDISPEQTFRDFKKTFKKKDFKETEVKHYFLTFYLASFLQMHSGLPRLVETRDAVETYKPLVKRNILKIYVAPNDSIFVNDNYVEFQDLRDLVIGHISDSTNSENSPEIELIEIDGFGKRNVSKQVISFLNHRSTSYDLYIKVQNELITAYREVRNEIGLKEFGVSYEQMLENRDKYKHEIKIIRKLLPQRISEADPINE
jgi:hypothetical protein